MIDTFSFNHPYFLLLIGVFLWLNHLSLKQNDAYYMPHLSLFKKEKNKTPFLPKFLKITMILSAIIALADPIILTQKKSIKKDALDIVLALDTSGSMSMYGFDKIDYNKSRLDVVKEVVTSFIEKRKDDRIGLVAFGTNSSIISPLSFDKKPQIQLIHGLEIGALGKSTALVDAIISCTKVLKNSPNKSKIIILLSDGEDSSSKTPLNIALKFTKKYNIKTYAIIIDKTHSDMMKIIAKKNKTKAYNPKDKKELNKVYDDIDKLEKSPLEYTTISLPKHLYSYPLSLAILCSIWLLFILKSRVVL